MTPDRPAQAAINKKGGQTPGSQGQREAKMRSLDLAYVSTLMVIGFIMAIAIGSIMPTIF